MGTSIVTLNDLYITTYRRALSSMREETDQLGASVGVGATSLSLATGNSLGSIQPGTILQVDWELYYVVSAPTPGAITVVPGYYDSTSTAHSAGALIIVNPRFPAVDIVEAINQDLDDLSSPQNGLFQVFEITLTYNPVIVGYDMTDVNTGVPVQPENLIDLLQVRVHEYGPAEIWPTIPLHAVKFDRTADTSVFPSGMSLKLLRPGYPGMPIRVAYKAPYNISVVNGVQTYVPLTNPTDNVQSVSGLHPQAFDILPMGAACRLMETREFKRSFTEAQPQPRISTEVPVGASLEAMKQVMLHRQQRIQAERARLERMWQVTTLV